MPDNYFDAIVIGSGISGGWAAKELCEHGLTTLVLERGRNVEHVKDYTDTNKHPWQLTHHGRKSEEDRTNSPIQSKIYAWNDVSKKYFVNDFENPYEQPKPFDWIRGYHVGGRSITWGRQCYRRGEVNFEDNAKDGYGVDWPIRYKDIAPWYSYVEKFVGVSGNMDGLSIIPDGDFLPPMEMNSIEKLVAGNINTKFTDGRRMIIGRTANLTRAIDGRGPCQYRNKCHEGCPFGGYFCSNSATLPAAKKTANLTLRPHSIVSEILYDKESRKAKGVRIIDEQTLQVHEYFSKIIFMNASTLGTTAILLNSTSEVFPEGLGNSSGQLGHNLMDMHSGAMATGEYEGLKDRYVYGRRPNAIFIPRFRNISEQTKRTDYVRGFCYQGWGLKIRPKYMAGIGANFKEEISEPGNWTMTLNGEGEHLPYFENKVTLNKNKKDKFGLPILQISCEFKENEKAMRKDMIDSAAEMLEASGLKNIKTANEMSTPGIYIGEAGTARMGKDPKTSVLNKWNQLHDVKNVFVTDGAAMASSTVGPGPSITYMALTARAVDYAVKELKKQNL